MAVTWITYPLPYNYLGIHPLMHVNLWHVSSAGLTLRKLGASASSDPRLGESQKRDPAGSRGMPAKAVAACAWACIAAADRPWPAIA